MSTSLFAYPLRWEGGITGGFQPRIEQVESQAGTTKVRKLSGGRTYDRNALVILDGSPGNSYTDWLDYQDATLNMGAESVLFEPEDDAIAYVHRESIGTVTGSGETFALDSKFVHHTDFGETYSTLEIHVVNTLQTLTTDYTVTLNGTTPTITSTGSTTTGAAYATYRRYLQVYVTQSGGVQSIVIDRNANPDEDQGGEPKPIQVVPVRIVQVTAGGHLV